jgi:hypothetical protein
MWNILLTSLAYLKISHVWHVKFHTKTEVKINVKAVADQNFRFPYHTIVVLKPTTDIFLIVRLLEQTHFGFTSFLFGILLLLNDHFLLLLHFTVQNVCFLNLYSYCYNVTRVNVGEMAQFFFFSKIHKNQRKPFTS